MTEQRDLDFQRPTALVTGATAGIGRAAAMKLAADGLYVYVHGRDATRGAATLKSIELAGGSGEFVAADLTNLDDLAHLVAEVGQVDVLVNNSGLSWFGATPALHADTFDAMFASNVRAAYYLVAAIAPAMAERGNGSIINVSSMAALVGLAGGAAYSATKASLAAMTRAWAAEYSPSGVRVNAIAPGPVSTGSNPQRIEQLGSTTLLNRPAQVDEIADVIAFLASPKASYITGAVVAADGGRAAI